MPARGFLHQRRALGGGFPFTLLTAARPPASAEHTATCASACAPGPDPRAGGPDGDSTRWCPGSSIGGCLSDFVLAPLRGLDVQTSPVRAEREGPARGRRRREAPPLKGAGRAPPLGRTRGRKERAGPPGPARGCERPQGGQPEGRGCVFGPPRQGQPRWGAGRGRLQAPASRPRFRGRGRQGPRVAVAARRRLVPSPEGPPESKAKASPRRGLCAGAECGGWPGRRRPGGG